MTSFFVLVMKAVLQEKQITKETFFEATTINPL
jgi:hypothetical protein